MDVRKAIGARVKEARTAAGLSQAALAERTGLGDEQISRIERGVESVTVDNLHRVAHALGVPFPSLFEIDGPGDQRLVRGAVAQEVVRMMDGASQEQLLLVRRVVFAVLNE